MVRRVEELQPFLTPSAFSKIIIPTDSECWIFTGARTKAGYANIWFESRLWRGHRLAYTLLIKPIQSGMELDHGCHDPSICLARDRTCPHRPCINPDHMLELTHGENQRRSGKSHDLRQQTHCKHGHPYTPRNTYRAKNGTRACKTCRLIQVRKTAKTINPRTPIEWYTADYEATITEV